MGQRQTPLQVVALLFLFGSACIMEKIIPLPGLSKMTGEGGTAAETDRGNEEGETPVKTRQLAQKGDSIANKSKERNAGVVAVLLASLLSGLAGALSQRCLQEGGGRNSFLFTMELSVASILFLLLNNFVTLLRKRGDSSGGSAGGNAREQKMEFLTSWKILIPMITNAIGGVLVGLVTKQVGTVKKGFALIFGLWLSGILQGFFQDSSTQDQVGGTQLLGLSPEQIVGAVLASAALWMHMTFKAV